MRLTKGQIFRMWNVIRSLVTSITMQLDCGILSGSGINMEDVSYICQIII